MVWEGYVREARAVDERARATGALHELRRAGELVARACALDSPDPFTNDEIRKLSVDYDPGDGEAAEWVAAKVKVLAGDAGQRVDFMVETGHFAAVLPALFGLGLGVSARLQIGMCQDVLDANWDIDVPERCRVAGVSLRSATAADVEEMVELNRKVFAAQPEHCWFGASPHYLDSLHDELLNAMAVPGTAPRLFERGGHIVGWYDYQPTSDSPWGPSGGMGIVFGPDAAGRGLLRVVYVDVASRLLDVGVPWFRGGTSQPAVMHLGETHGRRTIGAHVRAQHWFPPSHFGLG